MTSPAPSDSYARGFLTGRQCAGGGGNPSRGKGHEQDNGLKYARLAVSQLGKENDQGASSLVLKLTNKATWSWNVDR